MLPEINPYEPPQSEIKPASSENPRVSAKGLLFSRFVVPLLLGLQIVAAVLYIAFDFMQAMAHSGYHRLQAMAELFAQSSFVLGIALLLIALVRGSMKLVIFEILALLIFAWWTLPMIQ